MQHFLREGERLDDLERNRLKIIQDPKRFCFGMDAVLLSGMVKVPDGGRVIDLGTGTGILPLLLSAKTGASELIGLEIQEESADMARRSVAVNVVSGALEPAGSEKAADCMGNGNPRQTGNYPEAKRIRIVTGDLKEATALFGRGIFDAVTANPPYMEGGTGIANPGDAKAIARHELLCTFRDVAREAAGLLKPGGHFYLVHRPHRLAELITTLTECRLEPKVMQLVYPSAEKEPNMVLLDCVKGGGRFLTVREPLIIFGEDGKYTETVRELYGF